VAVTSIPRGANLDTGCWSKFANVLQRLRILTAGMTDTRRLHGRCLTDSEGHEPSNVPGRSNPGLQTVDPTTAQQEKVDASRHREVVQRGEGLRFHHP
jgi:hypothetical protein